MPWYLDFGWKITMALLYVSVHVQPETTLYQ